MAHHSLPSFAHIFRDTIILAAISIAASIVLYQFPLFQGAEILTWSGIAFFTLWSLQQYFFSSRAAQSDNKNTFIQVAMSMMGLKMLCLIVIVLGYKKIYGSQEPWLLVPFLLTFLLFFVYETKWMMKMATFTPNK